MKSSNSKPPICFRSGIAALVVAVSAAIGTGTVHAAGTASGTVISNQATLNFTVGGVPQTAITSAASTFTVDNRVNVLVTTTDATAVVVAPGATLQATTFLVTNTGNTPQDFALTSSQRAGGTVVLTVTDNFDATACTQRVESGATAGFQPAQDTATFIDELAADASQTVYVVCSIPAGQVNNDAAAVTLTATALAGGAAGQGAALTQTAGANTAGVDIVFGDGAGLDDAARDAAFSSRSAYSVTAPSLTVVKTVSIICDPFNSQTNPKNIPGAIVRWQITISNAAGAGIATLSTVSDAIAAATTFDPNLVTGVGTCTSAGGTPENAAGRGFRLSITGGGRPGGSYPKFFTTASDADAADLTAGTVTVNFAGALPVEAGYTAGELRANESVTVVFNVTVN